VSVKIVAENRRARFDYEIIDTFEVGIMLSGSEVKACRAGHITIAGAYISIQKNIPTLKQATITPYAFSVQISADDAKRDRVLLLHKQQIQKLQTALQEKGLAVIPLRVKAGKYIKLEIALAKGKKTIDKRHTLKERTIARNMKYNQEV
jgi:SsrA-binding protein